MLRLALSRPAEDLEIRAYSAALTLVGEASFHGPFAAGQVTLLVDSQAWPTGALYLQARIPGQGALGQKLRRSYLLP